MRKHIARRDFLRSSLIRTSAGWIALNEWLGSGMLGGARFVSAAERTGSTSTCEILPLSVTHGFNPTTWTLKYIAGPSGLPADWALAIRCYSSIEPPAVVSATSSWPTFDPVITIKKNIGQPRVIWIEPKDRPLPAGESLTITIENYAPPPTTASCAYSFFEMDPNGSSPEIGSGLTFLEVPCVGGEITANTVTEFKVVLPSLAGTREPMRIRIAAVDRDLYGNPDYTGTVTLTTEAVFKDLPPSITFTPEDKGTITFEATPLSQGVIRLEAADGVNFGSSNPCVCSDAAVDKIFWGDYHKHSVFCDGFLTPEENYDFARKYAFLDFAMLSSHDMKPFPIRGAHSWDTTHAATEAAHEAGAFVTFHGYEWSHNNPFSAEDARGHKVVIFLNPDHFLPLIPYCYTTEHPECMPPTTLIKKLKERCGDDVIVVPHHLPLYKWWHYPHVEAGEMGGPLPALGRRAVDRVQPVAEVFSSCCGNYETYDLQDWIKSPETFGYDILHTFWQDGLKEGVRAGVLCGSDNHNRPLGHPNHTSLTAVKAPSQSREAIFRAIQQRHTYGTSGPRVFIDFSMGKAVMGDIVKHRYNDPPPTLDVTVVSPLSIDRIQVIKVTSGHGEIPFEKVVGGKKEEAFSWTDPNHNPTKWVCYYLRIHLDDDTHGAWTSPIWLEPFHSRYEGEPQAK